MRRLPTRTVTGNLRWTRSGGVWADWLLTGLPYGLRPVRDKLVVRGLHQALLRALPGESLLLGVSSSLDPASVVDRMLDGVDLSACPEWAAECTATLDSLDALGPGQRVYWLSVPLGARRPADSVAGSARAAWNGLQDWLGLPRSVPSPTVVARWQAQAARVVEAIPSPFRPAPATPAQMVWLHQHMLCRGLYQDLEVPTPADGDVPHARAGSVFSEPLIDEGALSDADSPARARLTPWDHRYVKVTDVDAVDPAVSYQALLVVADGPDGGMVWPGSEFIGRIDESGVDVDWALRLTVRSSDAVAVQNQRALRNLNEQYSQREGEVSHGLNMLDRVAADLAEYDAILASDKLEVEAQATTIFCVAGPTADSARVQARFLADYLATAGYRLAQPVGYQEDLWWAMHPGVPTSRVVREYAQITTSRALSATVPLAAVTLGDTKGSLLGVNIGHGPLLGSTVTCGPSPVVLHDLDGASDRDLSGSLAVAGELGAGKALALDTPIPTPTGWSRMGDLVPGDMVFDELGQPTQVLGTSQVMKDHVCYEVSFSDGTTIVADAEHLWTTIPARVRSHVAKDLLGSTTTLAGPGWHEHGATVTTEQIRGSLHVRGQANHAVPLTAPLDLPAADLPIDPYVLGAWLGDGHSTASRTFSADPEVLGVCGNTHIPGAYLRASVAQRRALLAGLLDTDGTVSPGGAVEFTSTSQVLAAGVHELVCSLGYRAALRQRDAVLDGKNCGAAWTISFSTSDPVFQLPRKLRALEERSGRHDHARNSFRYIVDVRQVPSVPVRCIRVASPSQLFLAGKSMVPTHNTATLMKLAGDVVDRGGQLIIADRTAKGEWAAWAGAVTDAVVVDTASPALSLDPLRVFGARTGSRVMQSFLTPLLNVAPTSERGVLLSDVLDPDYLAGHGLQSAGALVDHLHAGCALPGASELARLINVFARRDLGRVIFDGSIPALDPTARAVVIRTHTTLLPSRDELEHEHLFAQMSLEKVYGRALNALIAALARDVCFADTSTLAGFVVSEAYSMTVSPEGERELVDFVRDGRKHRAVVMLDSHDPEADFGSPTLRGLIPTRILMRHRDRTLARRGLAWLDLDPDDEALVEMIRQDTSPTVDGQQVAEHRRGEAIMRDMSGNVGRVKIMLPARAARRAAITAGGTAAHRPRPAAERP